uniref:NR LBD domain-containing protein n=1 Tax=Rhabditophanes sp. KR3021 TaxID=114890 RepID=A0AC35TU31_9BILA
MDFCTYTSQTFHESAPLLIICDDHEDEMDILFFQQAVQMAEYRKKTLWRRPQQLRKIPSVGPITQSAQTLCNINIKFPRINESYEECLIEYCCQFNNECTNLMKGSDIFYQVFVDLKQWSLNVDPSKLACMLAMLSDVGRKILKYRNDNLRFLETQPLHLNPAFPVVVNVSEDMNLKQSQIMALYSDNVMTFIDGDFTYFTQIA